MGVRAEPLCEEDSGGRRFEASAGTGGPMKKLTAYSHCAG